MLCARAAVVLRVKNAANQLIKGFVAVAPRNQKIALVKNKNILMTLIFAVVKSCMFAASKGI